MRDQLWQDPESIDQRFQRVTEGIFIHRDGEPLMANGRLLEIRAPKTLAGFLMSHSTAYQQETAHG